MGQAEEEFRTGILLTLIVHEYLLHEIAIGKPLNSRMQHRLVELAVDLVFSRFPGEMGQTAARNRGAAIDNLKRYLSRRNPNRSQ